MSSVSSNNDFARANARLEDEGLREEFVFPKSNWRPNGQRLAALITEMQLRPNNVLFIDDNPLNLKETKHYFPEVMVALPDCLANVLDHPKLMGKAGPENEAAEAVPVSNDLEPDRHLHHHKLDQALDETMKGIPNAELCDLREIARSRSDTTLNVRHFNRLTYVRMAQAIAPMLGGQVKIVASSLREQARLELRDVRFRAEALAHRRALARH